MIGAPTIEVLRHGLLDTVQDLGRPGRAHLALSRGGAADRMALALANALVGNALDDAGLEITGPGPTLRFVDDAWIASVGARHRCTVVGGGSGDVDAALPAGRPAFVPAGTTLRWHAPEVGWRSWIAVAGGIAVPPVLGGRGAHLAAGVGPARLAAGDRLPLADGAGALARSRAAAVLGRDAQAGRAWPAWHVPESVPGGWPVLEVPVLPGRHLDALSPAARHALLERDWEVSPQSNRQGLRLDGEPLDAGAPAQLASEPVALGTVQLPPAGLPVILLCEHQTTGGYPRVLEAASVAEPVLAQAAPGCRLRLRLVGLDEADRLARRQAAGFAQRVAGVRTACGYPFEPEEER